MTVLLLRFYGPCESINLRFSHFLCSRILKLTLFFFISAHDEDYMYIPELKMTKYLLRWFVYEVIFFCLFVLMLEIVMTMVIILLMENTLAFFNLVED